MSESAASLTDTANVSHYALYFQDAGGSPTEWDGDPLRDKGFVISRDYLAQGSGYLSVESGGHTHTVSVTMERWLEEPPLQLGQWEISADAHITLRTGSVTVSTLFSGGMRESLRLGGAGDSFRARIYCTGRDYLLEAGDDFDIEQIHEKYLAQFWPAIP